MSFEFIQDLELAILPQAELEVYLDNLFRELTIARVGGGYGEGLVAAVEAAKGYCQHRDAMGVYPLTYYCVTCKVEVRRKKEGSPWVSNYL